MAVSSSGACVSCHWGGSRAGTRVLSGFALVAAAAAFATRASAETSPARPVRLTVEAPCTDAADFARRLRDRTHRIALDGADAVERVDVRIRIDDRGRAQGSFTITSPNESTRARSFEGARCDEIADVLSLAIALTYDPEALMSGPAPEPPPAAAPAPKPVPAPMPVTPPPTREPWHFRLGAHATIATTSSVPLGGEIFADASPRADGSLLRLGVAAAHGATSVGPASSDLHWFVVIPLVCPLRLQQGPFEAAPCAGASVGALYATADGIPNARSFVRTWVAPRASLLASAALTDRLAVEAQASLEAALVRGRYVFGNVLAYEQPVVVPSFGLGVVVSLDRAPRRAGLLVR